MSKRGKGIVALFAPMPTLAARFQERAARWQDGTKMNIDGKMYIASPVEEDGNRVTCCLFENVGKLTEVWQVVPDQRVIVELNRGAGIIRT